MKSATVRLFFSSVIVGAITYIVCIIIGMVFYPGGSQSDPISGPFTEGYSLWGNTLSDIGRMVAINGAPNQKAAIFFFTGTAVYGVSLLIFALIYPSLFNEVGGGKIISNIGRILGVIAAIGTLVYTFAPTDTMELAHITGVYFAYVGTLSFTLLFGIAVFRNSVVGNGIGIILIGFSVIYFISLIVLVQDISVPISMLMQKGGRLLMLLTLIFVSWTLRLKIFEK